MTRVVRPFISRFERLLHQRLALGIERRRRLVEQQQRRVAQDGAGDGETLPLAAGQRDAALADQRVEALRQAADELAGLREIGGTRDIGIADGIGAPKRILSAIARGEHDAFLRHQRNARRAASCGSASREVDAVESDDAGRAGS